MQDSSEERGDDAPAEHAAGGADDLVSGGGELADAVRTEAVAARGEDAQARGVADRPLVEADAARELGVGSCERGWVLLGLFRRAGVVVLRDGLEPELAGVCKCLCRCALDMYVLATCAG